ncbi:MAG: hypothetical protein ACKV19_29750 [Verrucomicrobiales bacterium]
MSTTTKNPKTETTLLCPGEEGWELWKMGPVNGFQPAGSPPTAPDGTVTSLMGARVFAFPVRAAFAVPLWVPSVDPEAVSGALDIQLEKLNLKNEEGGGQLVQQQTIEQADGQTLALATVLNERNLKTFPGGGIPEQFEISPFLFDLPENSLILWRELGKVVAVLTRRDRPIHFQTLGSRTLDAAAVHELELLLMQLDMQGLEGELERVVLWTDAVEPDAEAALRQAFGVPVAHGRKPVPELPEVPAPFLPRQVAEARVEAARRQRQNRLIALAAVLYLLVAAAYAFFAVRDILAANTLKKHRDALQSLAGNVDIERLRWITLLDVTHADRYPLERFFQVAKTLEEGSQVRLTKFTFEPNKLVITGEAENVPRAINYQNSLARDPGLADYEWERMPPRGEKNGFASFQVIGTLKNALPVQP